MSELDDRVADSQRVTDYLRSLQGGTPVQPPVVEPPIQPPVEPPIQPPVTGPVSFQTDLQFNGQRYDTFGISDQIAAFRIVIPAPLPDGWSGKAAPISVFENGNGTVWRHATLSKTMGDMSPAVPAAAGNTGPNLLLGFNSGDPSAVSVQSGDVWYVNVKNELWTAFSSPPYKPTVEPGGNGNFGVKLYPPS